VHPPLDGYAWLNGQKIRFLCLGKASVLASEPEIGFFVQMARSGLQRILFRAVTPDWAGKNPISMV
jgi:hypothetical protein